MTIQVEINDWREIIGKKSNREAKLMSKSPAVLSLEEKIRFMPQGQKPGKKRDKLRTDCGQRVKLKQIVQNRVTVATNSWETRQAYCRTEGSPHPASFFPFLSEGKQL